MTKTNLTKTAATVALVAILCLMVSAQGLSEAEAQKERKDLALSYLHLVQKLFPRNTGMAVVEAKGLAASALDYKLVADHTLFGDSMELSYTFGNLRKSRSRCCSPSG